jgi:hypothetical protein
MYYYARNYYFEKRRKEEAFDTSSVIRPGYDLNNYKFVNYFGLFIQNA